MFDYTKAGSGVPKNAPKKKRFFLFLELYGRKFWKLVSLNILYMVCCIPVITIGPATAGLIKVTRNFSMERNAFIWHDFFDSFKKNFKQSFVLGLIDILLTVSIGFGVYIYPEMAKENPIFYVLLVVSLSIGFTAVMMNFYAYLMIVATDLPLVKILKNSFYLTCIGIKVNLITLLVSAVTVIFMAAIIMFYPFCVFLLLIMPAAFIAFLISFNSYPLIQKYVINPYYEQQGLENPEYDYLKPLSAEDAIFLDKGGEEKPFEGVKKTGKNRNSAETPHKKGKTIS